MEGDVEIGQRQDLLCKKNPDLLNTVPDSRLPGIWVLVAR